MGVHTIRFFKFVLLILQVFSEPREPRLLGATQLTKEQIISNHKGSASVGLGLTDAGQNLHIGVVISPDTFISKLGQSSISSVIVANLIQPPLSNPSAADGEVYPVIGSPTMYNGDTLVRAAKFGPLKSGTQAVPATLAPAGTPPLPKGTEGCIVYNYRPNAQGDKNPDHFKLGYLPLTVLADSDCEFNAEDEAKNFCATVTWNGKSPFCNGDLFLVAFCPVSTFGNLKSVKPNVEEKWCHQRWWSWWCIEEDDFNEPEEKWVLVGLSTNFFKTSGCGVNGTDSDGTPANILVFYYTPIIN